MFYKDYKYVFFFLVFLLIVSGVISFFWSADVDPQKKINIIEGANFPSSSFIIKNTTKINLQKEFVLCRELNLSCDKIPVTLTKDQRSKLNGLSLEDLGKIYPREKMWSVEKLEDDKIVITNLIDGLCPVHKQIWHLGLDSSLTFVTVYYGPSEAKNLSDIYKVTDIPVVKLPQDFQIKIRDYTLEFNEKEELVAILDSLSEFL